METRDPASPLTIRKSTIGHRQSTNCHRAGLGSAKAAKRKNSFFVSTEAGMLLKTNKTRTKCMAHERTFSAKLPGFCGDQAQFSPLLAGESRCFGRKTRHGSASNGASQGPLKRTDMSDCRSHGARSQFKIQDSRFKKIANWKSRTEVENWNPIMEMPSRQVPVTNQPLRIANRQFPLGASWSILDRTEFQVTRAIGNAPLADARPVNPGLEATMFMIMQVLRCTSGILSEFVCY